MSAPRPLTRGLLATALAVAGVAVCAPPQPADARTAASCSGKRPTLVTFAPAGRGTTGLLSWARPRLPLRVALRYRVMRNGAVVGQTVRRRMLVRVSVGRSYRLRVRVVLPSGKIAPCPAMLTITRRRAQPMAPQNLAASGVGDRSATLSWKAGRARTGKTAGTRIYRDGEPLRQVKGSSTNVTLAPRRSYDFEVRTVDSTGQVSAASNSVTIRTGHRPPAAPQGLALVSADDSRAEIGWQPSVPGSGPVRAYRVYRDGTMLFQVPGTAATITGLAANRSYTITIAAVDGAGNLGERSVPLVFSTQPPVATRGRAHAFLLASTSQSFTDLRANYERIGTLYPTYYECAPDGSISGRDDPLVSRWAQARSIRVMPRVDCQSQTRIHQILNDPATRAAVLAQLGDLAATAGYDGLNVDFESGLATDRDALTSFTADLAAILHGQGKRISIAVSPTTNYVTTGRAGFYDHRVLPTIVDTMFVMNWGKHWSTSAPGALSDLPWATAVADYMATLPNRSRIVLGAAMYGMDWPAGGGPQHPATPLEHTDILALMARVGSSPIVDPVAAAPHFSYVDAQGVGHDVWYTDAATLDAHIRLAHDRGMGFGVWRLGREDQTIWAHPLLADPANWPAA